MSVVCIVGMITRSHQTNSFFSPFSVCCSNKFLIRWKRRWRKIFMKTNEIPPILFLCFHGTNWTGIQLWLVAHQLAQWRIYRLLSNVLIDNHSSAREREHTHLSLQTLTHSIIRALNKSFYRKFGVAFTRYPLFFLSCITFDWMLIIHFLFLAVLSYSARISISRVQKKTTKTAKKVEEETINNNKICPRKTWCNDNYIK